MHKQKLTAVPLRYSFLLVAVMMAHASPTAAAVTWNFFETSLVFAINSQPVPGFVPHVAGFLTISDANFTNGGVSYSAINHNFPDIPPNYTIVGPTDFSFVVDSTPKDPVFFPVSPSDPFVEDSIINISATSAGIISGSVQWDGYNNNLIMSISGDAAAGTAASDGIVLGCFDSQCKYTGTFFLVPEPGAIALLTTGLGLLGFISQKTRTKRRSSRFALIRSATASQMSKQRRRAAANRWRCQALAACRPRASGI